MGTAQTLPSATWEEFAVEDLGTRPVPWRLGYCLKYGSARGQGYTGKIAASNDGSIVFAQRRQKFSGFRKKDIMPNCDVDDPATEAARDLLKPRLRILFGGTCLAFCTTPDNCLLAVLYSKRALRTTLCQFTFDGKLVRKIVLARTLQPLSVMCITACARLIAYATQTEIYICDAAFQASWRTISVMDTQSICWTRQCELAVQTSANVYIYMKDGIVTLSPAIEPVRRYSVDDVDYHRPWAVRGWTYVIPFSTPVLVYEKTLTYSLLKLGKKYAHCVNASSEYSLCSDRVYKAKCIKGYEDGGWGYPRMLISLYDLQSNSYTCPCV